MFFDGKNRKCKVYEMRPRQCRTWPFWAIFSTCQGLFWGTGRLYQLGEMQKSVIRIWKLAPQPRRWISEPLLKFAGQFKLTTAWTMIGRKTQGCCELLIAAYLIAVTHVQIQCGNTRQSSP